MNIHHKNQYMSMQGKRLPIQIPKFDRCIHHVHKYEEKCVCVCVCVCVIHTESIIHCTSVELKLKKCVCVCNTHRKHHTFHKCRIKMDKPFQVGNHSLAEQHNQDRYDYPFSQMDLQMASTL